MEYFLSGTTDIGKYFDTYSIRNKIQIIANNKNQIFLIFLTDIMGVPNFSMSYDEI